MTTIAIFGAGGTAGTAIAAEARARGHRVTALTHAQADATDADRIAEVTAGHDVAVSSLYDEHADHATFYPAATRALLDGLGRAGVGRLVHVGLSVLLETAPGVRGVDDPGFNPDWLPFCLAHDAGAQVLRASTTGPDWVIVSPSGDFDREGTRTGHYELSTSPDATRLSYADFAVAVVDEIESRKHDRVHFGVAGV
ncbi:NAD(P)H-binding protein [Actinokineospora auranticolor]|uniref:NAD(P)-binding domain-containing protein n=1 Tax=Actinokineospora auranticolor TaxID=155976 RepID=A0A2S6GBA6_9PSEU|nr:NAD(P)H-binding protein [Actinokineospora auranticolor]PPK61093.1 hypothetical protein CLV40_14415 [Actinokineospora auranticolor]